MVGYLAIAKGHTNTIITRHLNEKKRSNVKEISAKLHHISKKFREFLGQNLLNLNCVELWKHCAVCTKFDMAYMALISLQNKAQKHFTTWRTFVSNCLIKNRHYSTSTLDDFAWRA